MSLKGHFSLTSSFLSAIAGALDNLSARGHPGLNSTLALLSALAVTVASSFSTRLQALLLVVAASGLAALVARKFSEWLLVTLTALFFASLVSLPAIAGFLHGEKTPVPVFVARAVASASAFTAFYAVLGWRGLVSGLRGLAFLGSLGDELAFTVRFIPLFAWKTLRLISAREARLLVKSRSFSWTAVNSVAGSVLASAYAKAYWARLAFASRNFDSRLIGGAPPARPGKVDAAMVIFSAVLVFVLVV
ncbi:hypothetical protein IG193_02565 [Infirmifilum lucidum]|uniref:Cobalt transport protein n=1 Tax=Infirmifilum lucidum TaxID=2776706 RepID=A0A7L9FK98_9CREN|nr:CbiQ family ECF transporter T component [Infirmifilum lucidum]QOJ79364.1 hypothetical protein IG193_02565 [Infirmifilum lucidum]